MKPVHDGDVAIDAHHRILEEALVEILLRVGHPPHVGGRRAAGNGRFPVPIGHRHPVGP